MHAYDSDVVFLDADPYASQSFNRFELAPRERPRTERLSYFDLDETVRRREPRAEQQPVEDDEPAWLRALSNAGIPVCTLCGCRNPIEAVHCLDCQQPLRWKRTRRIKLPLDTSGDKLKLRKTGLGFWGSVLVALLLGQLATFMFMVSETVLPDFLARF